MAREGGHSHRTMDALNADDVAAYLREHPDFLNQHGDLVQHLTPPAMSHGNGVADFQNFMVERFAVIKGSERQNKMYAHAQEKQHELEKQERQAAEEGKKV